MDEMEQHAFWLDVEAQPVFAFGEEEQQVFWSDMEALPTFAAGEDEQHVFKLNETLEHDCGLPSVASGTNFFVLSRLDVEQLFFGLVIAWSFTGDRSVA